MDAPLLTTEQREWLAENRRPRDRWLASSNAGPMIRELCDLGIMQPAYGEFGPAVDKGETINLFGKVLPVEELTSLYMLTPFYRDRIIAEIETC